MRGRRQKGPIKGELLLAGMEGDSAPLDPQRFQRTNPVIGVFPPKAVSWPTLAAIIDDCRHHFRARKIVIRWHPSMFDVSRLTRVVEDLSGVVVSPMSASLPDVARHCDWVVADENSNVHLPVLKLGIPTVAVRNLGVYPDSRSDLYGFVASGFSFRRLHPSVTFGPRRLSSSSRIAGPRSSRSTTPPISALRGRSGRRFDTRYGSCSRIPGRRPSHGQDDVRHLESSIDVGLRRARALEACSQPRESSRSGALLFVLYRSLDIRLIGEALLRVDRFWLVVSVGMILPITVLRAIRFYWVAPARRTARRSRGAPPYAGGQRPQPAVSGQGRRSCQELFRGAAQRDVDRRRHRDHRVRAAVRPVWFAYLGPLGLIGRGGRRFQVYRRRSGFCPVRSGCYARC